jgi:DUF971 family protein
VSDLWPTELRIKDHGRSFEMHLESGENLLIPAELLRVESPSAEVKGHGPGQETLVWGKHNVLIMKADPVGNYAVRLHFNDGHNTGLFTWAYLADLGRNQTTKMTTYEEKLKTAGLRR